MRAFVDFPDSEKVGEGVHEEPRRLRAQFSDPIAVLTAWLPEEVPSVLAEVQVQARNGNWCVGAVAYEAAGAFDTALPTHVPRPAWPLARFAVFAKALPWPEAMAGGDESFDCAPWQFSMSREVYAERLERARKAMADGECYQVNLTGTLRSVFSGDVARWADGLRAAQPGGYFVWLDWGEQQVLSFSPELFFDWRPDTHGATLTCRPMKGTAPRHADAQRDAQARGDLSASEKERAENVMIVDLLRSDLGRIAVPGSVRTADLFSIEALPTVWQMTSTVRARTALGTGLVDVFGALFPCGSITGAPKARAMHWIKQLEEGPRGIYCGAAGFVRPGGAATFNVPIRTLALQRAAPAEGVAREVWVAHYGVGSGVTFYADAESEWRELAAKSRLLERAPGGFELLETLRLEDGEYWLLPRHLKRLAGSARYFGFPFSAAEVRIRLEALAQDHHEGLYRVRLTLARSGKLQAQVHALAPTPEPVPIALSNKPLDTLGGTHEFVLHKTARRHHYDSRMLPDPALFDTLLLNERGELTEFTRGNLAMKKAGQWLTPALRCGVLPGTYREDLLESGKIAEAVLTAADLEQAEALAFFNSLRGWLAARLER